MRVLGFMSKYYFLFRFLTSGQDSYLPPGPGKELGKSPHCPAGWTYFDFTQKCYKYFGEKKKHADALKHCLEETGFSGGFAEVENEETNHFLFLMSKERQWIAGERCPDNDKVWRISDSKPMIYNAWHYGEPSGDGPCFEKNFPPNTVGTWNDVPCHFSFVYVCQQDAVPSVVYETNYPHAADLKPIPSMTFYRSKVESSNNYWISPNGKPGEFILKYPEVANFSRCELVNTHNQHYKDRACKDIEVLLRYRSFGKVF